MDECIFCKIVKGEIPSTKVWEDEEFLAILDIQPIVRGMTVVLPKKHYPSKVFEMEKKSYKKFLEAGRKVARKLKKALDVKRVFMVIEGVDVDHAHLKLYPIKKEKPLGLILTQKSKRKNQKELEKVAKEIKA